MIPDLEQREAALAKYVRDPNTRADLARFADLATIQAGIDLATSAKTAKDTGGLLVAMIRRGTAKAEADKRALKAQQAAEVQGRAEAARLEAARQALAGAEKAQSVEAFELAAIADAYGSNPQRLRDVVSEVLAGEPRTIQRAVTNAAASIHALWAKAQAMGSHRLIRSKVAAALASVASGEPRIVPETPGETPGQTPEETP